MYLLYIHIIMPIAFEKDRQRVKHATYTIFTHFLNLFPHEITLHISNLTLKLYKFAHDKHKM